MTAPATPTPTPAPPAAPQEGEPAEAKTFDAEYVAKLRKESAKYRTEAQANADAAKRLAEIEEAQKTETQKLTERAEQAERDRAAAVLESLRFRVAAEKGLTPKQAARLQGTTEDELKADADELLAEFASTGPQPFGTVDQGVRKTTPAPNQDEKQVARALFGGST